MSHDVKKITLESDPDYWEDEIMAIQEEEWRKIDRLLEKERHEKYGPVRHLEGDFRPKKWR